MNISSKMSLIKKNLMNLPDPERSQLLNLRIARSRLSSRSSMENGEEELVPIPTGLNVEIEDGVYVFPGDILGKTSRITVKQSDITGGLPRVQDLFEARVPKDKAILSEIAGIVSIGDLTKSGRVILYKSWKMELRRNMLFLLEKGSLFIRVTRSKVVMLYQVVHSIRMIF